MFFCVGCFFATFKPAASQASLCLLPLRWEFKSFSLDDVTKHKAQVHSLCTSFSVEEL
jgi:hypothetical protein